MKRFLLFIACITTVQSLTAHQKERFQNYGKACMYATGLEKDVKDKLRQGDFAVEDPALKRFSFCMLLKLGLLDTDGSWHGEVQLQFSEDKDKKNVEEVVDKCVKQVGKVDVETSWDYAQCYHSLRPQDIIL